MQNKVLVVGSVALDDVETPFGRRDNALGGSAIYFSLAASCFARVQLVGVAGQDYPPQALALLHRKKIDIEGLNIVPGETFRWGGKYHTDMNHRDTLYTYLNVFADFKPTIPERYRQTPFIFLGNIQPSLQLEVLRQMQAPQFVALDTMNLWINTARSELMEVIRQVHLLMINDSELFELTNQRHLLSALSELHHTGPRIIVIKKGEHGALLSYYKKDRNPVRNLFYAPVYPVRQATDPTGAGDSFAGGFLGYLTACSRISFRLLKKATLYGSIMGSFVVEGFGVDGLLKLNATKIDQRYRLLRRMVALK